MRLEITPAALIDLDRIRQHGDRVFGTLATDNYLLGLLDLIDLICFAPNMAREQAEILPGIRAHPFEAHVVLYRIESNKLSIIRILHGRQNWSEHIS
jgi:toxin ParE1/3/4